MLNQPKYADPAKEVAAAVEGAARDLEKGRADEVLATALDKAVDDYCFSIQGTPWTVRQSKIVIAIRAALALAKEGSAV